MHFPFLNFQFSFFFIVRYEISNAVWFRDSYTEEAELEAAKIKMLSYSLEESVM